MHLKEIMFTRRNILKYAAAGTIALSAPQIIPADASAQTVGLSDKKVLTLYFSKTDTTGKLARQIHSIVGGDIAKLETVAAYPSSYNATTEQAKKEQEANFRPKVKPVGVDINSYDIIFLGYPCWWGTLPMAYFTFFEEHNPAGKIIAPFSTHEGSNLGRSITDLKQLCKNSTVLDGYAVTGKNSDSNASKEITNWLQKIHLA